MMRHNIGHSSIHIFRWFGYEIEKTQLDCDYFRTAPPSSKSAPLTIGLSNLKIT